MGLWYLYFAGLIYLINIISMISLIFFQKKDMSVTFAWLLVLIFIPLLGFILYFFFGSTHKLNMMSRKYRMEEIEKFYSAKLAESIEAIWEDEMPFYDPHTENYRDMIIMNGRDSKCLYTENNNVELLINGQEKFPRMFQEIEQAKDSLNVLYFIIKSRDEIGKKFIDLLARKAAEGVAVKVVYDGFGWLKTRRKDFAPIEEAGGVVQRFLPSLIKNIVEVNYRLHRKMVIIDGKIAYTGGINVGDDYLGLYPRITPWRDTSVRVCGAAVNDLQIRFFEDWVFLEKQNKKLEDPIHKQDVASIFVKYFPNRFPEGEAPGHAGVQIISCGPDSRYPTHRDSYMKLCSAAKAYLYIQTPYFVPDQALLESIRLAATSGVDVRIMLPGIPDKNFVYKVAMSYVEELLAAGIRVYTHKGFLHAKTMVIDDYVASVGSTNLDLRSFKLDYELNTLVYDQHFAQLCKATFLRDVEDCREIDLAMFKRRGNFQKALESICRFVAPLS